MLGLKRSKGCNRKSSYDGILRSTEIKSRRILTSSPLSLSKKFGSPTLHCFTNFMIALLIQCFSLTNGHEKSSTYSSNPWRWHRTRSNTRKFIVKTLIGKPSYRHASLCISFGPKLNEILTCARLLDLLLKLSQHLPTSISPSLHCLQASLPSKRQAPPSLPLPFRH